MLSVIRRHPILRLAGFLLVFIVVCYAALVWTVFIHHLPQAGPYVEVVTTRCLGPDGMPVGEYGLPCPSGTTQDTLVIQSHLPTGQP